jgi:puromycin-sensitive aminopeptidase
MSSSTREHEHGTPAQPANAVDRLHADSSHRLPSSVRPSHYHLHLTPNLTAVTFTASVTITVSILQPTRSISLNAAELDIKSATLSRSASASSSSPLTASISYRKDDEVAVFTFDSELQPGEAEMAIEYAGQHNDKMRGCYRSRYRSARTGKDEWMIVTQFESTDARRALPCFDEPALKATFTVELTVDPQLKAVSNMPIVDSREGERGEAGLRTVTHRFDKTPVMSTYLLAWCVGEFDVLEDTTSDGIVIRCFTPVGRQQQGKFALECAIRILPFYNSFFKYKYPLPKLDMLAIQDFAAGAVRELDHTRSSCSSSSTHCGLAALSRWLCAAPAVDGELGNGDVSQLGSPHRRGEQLGADQTGRGLDSGTPSMRLCGTQAPTETQYCPDLSSLCCCRCVGICPSDARVVSSVVRQPRQPP